MENVCQKYWDEIWRCPKCVFTTPYKELKESSFDVSDLNKPKVVCERCDHKGMERTILRDVTKLDSEE